MPLVLGALVKQNTNITVVIGDPFESRAAFFHIAVALGASLNAVY